MVEGGKFPAKATPGEGIVVGATAFREGHDQLGVSAVAKIGEGGQAPSLPKGEDYLDTGTQLVTAKPLSGIKSQTVDEGRKKCWGTAGG